MIKSQSNLWFLAGIVMLALNGAVIKIGSWTTGWGESSRALALTVAYSAAGASALAAMILIRESAPRRGTLAWILCAGLAVRALSFAEPPRFESDFYRYLWDGAVTAHGYNPYAIRPLDVIEGRAGRIHSEATFRSLAQAGQPVLQHLNHSDLTTIYPPVAQGCFALAYWISPFSVNALRAEYLLAEFGTVVLLLALLRTLNHPAHWIAIYWWNPIPIKEFYVSAHMDGLAVFFAMAAMSAVLWRWRWTGIVLLGTAIGVKLWPVMLAPILLRYGTRSRRQVFGGLFLLVVVAGLLTWPLLAGWGRESQSGVNAYAHQWINNAGFFSLLHALTQSLHDHGILPGLDPHTLAREITGFLVLAWMGVLARRPLPDANTVTFWCLLSVARLFMISPTQFPWYFTWVLPFLVLMPSRALLLYTALLPLYQLHYDHPWVLWIEHLPVWLLIAWSLRRWPTGQLKRVPLVQTDSTFTLPPGRRVAVLIPALNEEHAISHVVAAIPRWVSQVVVVDNGSSDATADMARQSGAIVVHEPRRGYGAACLAGLAALDRPEIVVFLDGDFSDSPEEMGRLVQPIVQNEADLVIGSRVAGNAVPGSLSPQQRFGNALACHLIQLIYGVRYSDLGPFRAIRYSALRRLAMDDQNYGWTVQMQVRAARLGLRAIEAPVSYRNRIGRSKISGTLRGVIGASTKILYTVAREICRKAPPQRLRQLIVFTRYPEAGRTKTRMIPAIGAERAAELQRRMTAHTLAQARQISTHLQVKPLVRYAGGSEPAMRALYGNDLAMAPQGDGDLGQKLFHAATEAFNSGVDSLVLCGADCPEMTSVILEQAFGELSRHDVVLGPAVDGGYYLIGLRHPWPDLFESIDWGTERVFDQTKSVAERMGLSVATLPMRRDVDRPEDLPFWEAVQQTIAAAPVISVIIPTLNEENSIARAIKSAKAFGVEIIVVDGGSTDRTLHIAQSHGASVISSPRGRAKQMNAGAAMAKGQNLLFLHADSLLPTDYVHHVRKVLALPGTVGGAFLLTFEPTSIAMKLIAGMTNLRSRWFQIPYGDQAIFLSKAQFSQVDGFPDLPIMEDLDFVRRLKRAGRIGIAESRVSTSARRWQRHGAIRMTLLNQILFIAYHLGCPVDVMLQWRESGKLFGHRRVGRRNRTLQHTVK